MIRSADWYVCTPNIHLRYYLEEWSDILLIWVKYFLVSDLHYSRYQALANFEATRDTIRQQCELHGGEIREGFHPSVVSGSV